MDGMRMERRPAGKAGAVSSRHLPRGRVVGICLVALVLWGCGDDGGGGGREGPSYRDLLVPLTRTLMTEAGYEDGRWSPDPDGSASLWAPAYLFAWAEEAGDPAAAARAKETVEALLADLQGPLPADPARPILCFPACFAALQAGALEPEEVKGSMEGFLNTVDRKAERVDHYLEGVSPSVNPTLLTALLAWDNLLYRDFWDWPRTAPFAYPGVGLDLLESARSEAWDEAKGCYRPFPWSHELEVSPNAWMVVALMKGFENEELVPFQADADRILAALETLWDPADGGYLSGTDSSSGLKTLEENNEAVTALLMLYKNLARASDLARAEATMDFIARWLYRDGTLYGSVRDGGVQEADVASVGESFHLLYNILLAEDLGAGRCRSMLGRRPMNCSGGDLPGDGSPGRERDRFEEPFDAILETLLYKVPWRDGDILYDYGDMPGYAATLLFDLARETGEAEYAEKATAVADRIIRLMDEDLVYYLAEISFGGFALYAAKEYYGPERPAYEEALDRLLGLAAFLTKLDGYYLDILDRLTGGGNYGYGATALTAQVAYSLFLSRYHPPDAFRPGWKEFPEIGVKMVDAADREAWNDEEGYYYKSPSEPEIYLIADGYMVYALVEAYRYTGREAYYLDRARRVVAALERILGDPEGGGFYALPPALPAVGYKSLSSSSYGFKACALLYQVTGEEEYLEKARSVMDFLLGTLYGDGIIYHHQYAGVACRGDLWCPGCDFRILQYMDYLVDLERNGAEATKDRP